MSQTSLLFWSARFLIFGAILLVAGINFYPGYTIGTSIQNEPLFFPSTALIAAGTLLILMPFPLLYAFQAEKRGFIGFLGFVLSFAGLASLGLSIFISGLILPYIPAPVSLPSFSELVVPEINLKQFETIQLISTIVMSTGFLVLGISGLKAKIYSSAVPVLFITGAVSLVMLPIQPYNLQLGISLISLGIVLAGSHIYGEAKS